MRLVGLAECGTHAVFGAGFGPYASTERALARRVVPALGPDMLLLADRGFAGYDLWQMAAATGADLLWRASNTFTLPVRQMLLDGSYLSRLVRKDGSEPITVRVVEYTIDDGRAPGDEHYRLVTTLLDPSQAPAAELAELAELYAQRWEFENAIAEPSRVKPANPEPTASLKLAVLRFRWYQFSPVPSSRRTAPDSPCPRTPQPRSRPMSVMAGHSLLVRIGQ